jgi:hypothetical protein
VWNSLQQNVEVLRTYINYNVESNTPICFLTGYEPGFLDKIDDYIDYCIDDFIDDFIDELED